MKPKRIFPILQPVLAAAVLATAAHGEDAHKAGAAHGPATTEPAAPYKLPDAEAPHAHVEKFGGHEQERRYGTLEQRWKARLQDARQAEKLGRDEEAEKILWELSGPPYSESLNRDAYPILIDYYAKRGQRVKLIELYEKFSTSYPQDPELPEVFFRLGNLYREFGAYELAQSRFYNVLSTTLRSARTEAEKEEFRQTSLRAQIEIADIYLELGNHEKATQFFDRLLRLDDLDPANVARAEFKRAYAKYNVAKDLDGRVEQARSELNQYLFEKTETAAKEAGADGIAALDASKDARVLALEARENRAKTDRNKAIAQVIAYLMDCGPASQPFYEAYPDHEHAPEAHYLLATVYKWQDTESSRKKAHDEVVRLLEKANKGIRSKRVTLSQDHAVSLKFIWDGARNTWLTANGREASQQELARIGQALPASPSKTEVFLSAQQSNPEVYVWDKDAEAWEDAGGKAVDADTLARISEKIDLWVSWQKKAGNQLANEYFENGKNIDAIGIYQKLLALDSTPKWQAPIVYQLGLCFERIGGKEYNPKAIEAYEILTVPDKNPRNWADWSKKMEADLGDSAKDIDANLASIVQNQEQFIYRMAEWRLRNLRWNRGAANEVKRYEIK